MRTRNNDPHKHNQAKPTLYDFVPRAARYLVLVRDTPLTAPLTTAPNEGGEKQFFRRRTENPCPHLCFTGASTFAAPGAVANARNSFSAGGPKTRARIFVLLGRAHLPRRAQLLM